MEASGISGDRIAAVGDLSAADPRGIGQVIEAVDLVVCPGFVDPHGHSDASLLVDPTVASHLHQGYATQLSGNCGETLAPLTKLSREPVELMLAATERTPRWRTFAGYLEAIEA